MVEIVATAVFAAYMLIVLGIGIYAARITEHNPLDFYVATRKVGIIVLAFTIMATILSAFTFFGIGATASGTGLGTFPFIGLETTLFGIVFAVVGVKISRVGRKLDVLTPPQYFGERYDSDLPGMVYLIFSAIFLISFVATQIIGGAVALEVLVEIPFTWGAVVISVFMAVYIHISGFRGVIWSDTLQGGVMFASLVGLFILALVTVGPGELLSGVQGANSDLLTYVGPIGLWDPIFTLTFTIAFIFGVTAYPQIFQRFVAAPNNRVLRRSSMLFPLIGVPIFFVATALGVWSTGVIPDPANPDYIIPLLVQELTGPILTGIILAAGVAALMSTADSVLLSVSSMIARDIYARNINPGASGEREVRVSQVVLLVLIALSLALAVVRPAGIFELGAFSAAAHVAFFPALVFSLWWKRATAEAAVLSMLVSGVLMLGWFTEVLPPAQHPYGMHYGFVGFVIAIVTFVVVTLVTSEVVTDTVDTILEA